MNDRHVAKLKVFISYSRADLLFADQLVAALDAYGYEIIIDRHSIVAGEPFKDRLAGLILEADTCIFVLSPKSVEAPYVLWEVEEAHRRGKRLVPIVCERLGDSQVPPLLEKLDYIFFYPEAKSSESGFGKGIKRLTTALDTDIDWIRNGTRIMAMAARWESRDKLDALLLRGPELEEAEKWIATRPPGLPEPSAPLPEFVRSSRAAETARNNQEAERLKEMAMAQEARARALEEKEVAQKRHAEALEREGTAQAAKSVAQRRNARTTAAFVVFGLAVLLAALWQTHANSIREAQLLTSRAQQAFDQNQYEAAMRYALASLPPVNSSPLAARLPHSEVVLARAAYKSRLVGRLGGADARFDVAIFSEDGSRVLARTKGESSIGIWDSGTGRPIARLTGHTGEITGWRLLNNGQLLSMGTDGTARIWDIAQAASVIVLEGIGEKVASSSISGDYSRIALWSAEQPVTIWDAQQRRKLAQIDLGPGRLNFAELNKDGSRLLTISETRSPAGRSLDDSQTSIVRIWNTDDGKEVGPGWSTRFGFFTLNDSGNRALVSGAASVRRWVLIDVVTGKEIEPAQSGNEGNYDSFRGNGKFIIEYGFRNPVVRIRDWANGNVLHHLDGHKGGVRLTSFNAKTNLLAVLNREGGVSVWNPETGQRVSELAGLQAETSSIGFDPTGERLITKSESRVRQVWRVRDGKEILRFEFSPTASVVFGTDGTQMLSYEQFDPDVRLWTLSSNQPAAIFSTPGSPTASMSKDGSRALTRNALDRSGAVWLWDARPLVRLIADEAGRTGRARFAANNINYLRYHGLVVRTEPNGRATIWDAANRTPQIDLGKDDELLAISDNGRRAAVRRRDEVHIFGLTDGGKVLATFKVNRLMDGFALSADGSRLVAGNMYDPENALIEVWDTSRQALVAQRKMSSWITQISISPSGDRVGVGMRDQTLEVFSPDNPAVSRATKLQFEALGMAFTPDGGRLLQWGQHNDTIMLDAATLDVVRTFKAGRLSAWVMDAAVSSDGKHLLTVTDDDNSVQVWSIATGEMLGTPMKHDARVRNANLSADGKYIATAAADGRVRVWDFETGLEIVKIDAHAMANPNAQIFSGFNKNGTELHTLGEDGKIRIWDIGTAIMRGDQLRAKVCDERLNGAQSFDDEERKDAVLRGNPALRNPCDRHGLLSLRFWLKLPGTLLASASALFGRGQTTAAAAS